ncbi:MAG: hypothetical protein VKP72_02535 [bacterium]|nr:hypothetical protein [bacterium]
MSNPVGSTSVTSASQFPIRVDAAPLIQRAPAAPVVQPLSLPSAPASAVNQVQSPSRPTSLALPSATPGVVQAQAQAPLPAAKAPDSGKTWGGPDSKQPLNFGHPARNGKLIEMDPSGIPVWASSGKALTADQYAAMPEFQKKQIRDEVAAYACRPGVPADRRLLDAFDAAMQGGAAARVTTAAPSPAASAPSPSGQVAVQASPAPVAQPSPASAIPAAPAVASGGPAPARAAAPATSGTMTPEAADAKVLDVIRRLGTLETSAPRAAREAAFKEIESLLSTVKDELGKLPTEGYGGPRARLKEAESRVDRFRKYLDTLT